MNNRPLNILLKPSYGTSAEKLELDPSEVYENDVILFQQGFDMEQITVKPGERFGIPAKYEYGIIDCTDVKYKLFNQNDEDDFQDDEFEEEEYDVLKLNTGNYFFHTDGVGIALLTEGWSYDEFEEEEPEEIEFSVLKSIVKAR